MATKLSKSNFGECLTDTEGDSIRREENRASEAS